MNWKLSSFLQLVIFPVCTHKMNLSYELCSELRPVVGVASAKKSLFMLSPERWNDERDEFDLQVQVGDVIRMENDQFVAAGEYWIHDKFL